MQCTIGKTPKPPDSSCHLLLSARLEEEYLQWPGRFCKIPTSHKHSGAADSELTVPSHWAAEDGGFSPNGGRHWVWGGWGELGAQVTEACRGHEHFGSGIWIYWGPPCAQAQGISVKAICSLEGQAGFSNGVGGKSEDSRSHLLDAQQCSQLSSVLEVL